MQQALANPAGLRRQVLGVVTVSCCFFLNYGFVVAMLYLQCFDAVGWAAGRASGL